MKAMVHNPVAHPVIELADERERLLAGLRRHALKTVRSLGSAGVLAQAGAHALKNPGKLLRPMLLLEACKAVGGNPDAIFPAAAGTEYGHIASLIHDDIIDGDSQRRGEAALHVKYTLPDAILAGDLLIFETFLSYTECRDRGVSSERIVACIRLLSKTCIDICLGQAIESGLAGNLSASERMYLKVIRLKTASFYRAAPWIGATLGGGSLAEAGSLARYGHNLGMAFQIVDDILSYDGTSFLLGKPLSSDLRNRRVTLPVIYALQAASPPVRRQIARLFRGDTNAREVHEQLVGLLASTGGLERARTLARRYTLRAKHHLEALPPSPSRERLESWADLYLTRDH